MLITKDKVVKCKMHEKTNDWHENAKTHITKFQVHSEKKETQLREKKRKEKKKSQIKSVKALVMQQIFSGWIAKYTS